MPGRRLVSRMRDAVMNLIEKWEARPQFESWRPLRGISPMPISKTDPLLRAAAHRNAGVALSGSFCSWPRSGVKKSFRRLHQGQQSLQ